MLVILNGCICVSLLFKWCSYSKMWQWRSLKNKTVSCKQSDLSSLMRAVSRCPRWQRARSFDDHHKAAPLSRLSQQYCWSFGAQTCVCRNNFITLLIALQHIHKSQWCLATVPNTQIPMHKNKGTHSHYTTTVTVGESFASKAGSALLEGKKRILGSALYVFGDNQGSKKSRLAQTIWPSSPGHGLSITWLK